jgi:hypothetical protein
MAIMPYQQPLIFHVLKEIVIQVTAASKAELNCAEPGRK